MAAFGPDGSQVLFESFAPLLPDAAPGVDNLYEWNANKPAAERLALVGVLPDGSTPIGGSFAGAYNWAYGGGAQGGALEGLYTQDTLSADGSNAIFTTGGSEGPTAKQVYVREHGATTVQASASQRSEPDPNGTKPAAFMAATPDGAKVFFASCQKLTNGSTAVSTSAPTCTTDEQGQDLYEYDTASRALIDLTGEAVSDPATAEATHGAAVQGVLGTSEDGSYVYFAANGVLAPGATPGDCVGTLTNGEIEEVGACNLYVWHEGTVKFIARQDAAAEAGSASDVGNWRPTPQLTGQGQERSSRVTPDGLTLLFRSKERLTSYDNRPAPGNSCNDAAKPGGEACSEFYLYKALTGQVACVSCNPSGAPPTGEANLQSVRVLVTSPPTPSAILTRNLSSNGNRVFFESPDALTAQDTNGQQDVYEWEAAGEGSCDAAAGCLFLLSSGHSADPSFFADASTTGDDVFLFTSQRLVGQDQDQNVDVYDARVQGGLAAQNSTAAVPCSGDACRAGLPAQSSFAEAPASATLTGSGNLAPPPLAPAAKPLTRVQKLERALRACRRIHTHRKRVLCQKRARKRYAPPQSAVHQGRDK